ALSGGACRALRFDQTNAFDSGSVLGVDDELPTVEGEMVANLGDASGEGAEKAAESVVLAVGEAESKCLDEISDVQASVDAKRTVGLFFIPLFFDCDPAAVAAHDRAEDALEVTAPHDPAVLVHHHGHVDLLLLHLPKQIPDRLYPGNEVSRAQRVRQHDQL